MRTIFRCGLVLAAVMPLVVLPLAENATLASPASDGASPIEAPSKEVPSDADRGGTAGSPGPDLVRIDVSARGLLVENRIPVIWKGASFFLARWDEDQQSSARDLGVSFEVLAEDFDPTRQLYLFEVAAGDPPSQWQDHVLYEDGRKWLLQLDPAAGLDWIDLDHAVRIPQQPTGWGDPVPLVAYDCAYDPLIAGLLDRTDEVKWLDWIEKLSGEEPVIIDGEEHSILTRHSTPMFTDVPHARGYDFVLQQVQSWHYGPTHIEEHEYSGLGGQTWKNLIVTLPGLQPLPDEMVLMTAHLDSMSPSTGSSAPGADDNGSGTATLLEAARLMRQYRFQRTIRIVFFTGEEDGLIGSGAYVSDHNMDNHLGVVNLDMMGYDGDDDRCFEIHAGTIPASVDVANCFRDSTQAYNLGLAHDFLTIGATDRSDHASFWQVNVGAIEIAENFFWDGLPDGCAGQDQNPYYHTTSDVVDHLAVPFGSSIARAGLATVAAMAIPLEACFDESPVLSTTPGESSVVLDWAPLQDAASYRVYRSTQGCQGQWMELGETQQTQWNDTTADEARTYFYLVEAVDDDGFCVSAPSACAAAEPTVHHASTAAASWIDSCASGGPGDGNGIVEPGESVLVPVTLRNDGNAPLSGITGVLSVPVPGIAVVDPYGAWPDLAPGSTSQSMPNHFGLQASPDLSCGTAADADIDLTYAEGANTTRLPVRIGTTNLIPLIDEDFSAGIPWDWVVVDGGNGGGPAATWTTDNPGGRSIDPPFQAPFAIVDSDDAGSGASQDEQLITPYFDASGCAELTLEFSNQFNWYSGSADEFGDVDVTQDGGWNWTNVLRIQGGDDGHPDPNTKSVDLTPHITSALRLRFHYHQASYEWWWAVDNVKLICAQPVCNPCAAVSGSPGEPGTTVPVSLTRDSGDLVFQWGGTDPACDTSDYAVYRGDLGTLRSTGYSHDTELTCTTAGGTTFAIPEADPRLGEADYYLVVADNGIQEGSYGRDSSDLERPASSVACHPAQNMATCVP